MLQAARMRHVEGKDNQQIADELGVSHSTVGNYFSQEDMTKFEEYFSEEAKQFLKVQMKQRIEDGTKLANNLVAKAIQDERAKPRTKIKASKQAQKIPERYIKMMQELGVIQKPKDRVEKTEKSGEITFNEEIVTKDDDEVENDATTD